MIQRFRIFSLLLVVFAVLTGTLAHAARDIDPVEAGQDGLIEAGDYPWYDAEQDALRSIEFKPAPPPREIRDWEWTTPNVKTKNVNWGWGFWGSFWRVVQTGIWVLLAVLLAVAIYYGVRASALREGALAMNVSSDDDLHAQAQRIEQLPFQVDKPLSDLLAEAKRLYTARRYGEAIVYLFSHQLVQLDKHQMIRLAKGKTNRQYLRELRSSRGMSDLLGQTMVAFEDFFFGDHTIDQQRFESCWNRLDEFDRALGSTL